jgi:hypothetical protein
MVGQQVHNSGGRVRHLANDALFHLHRRLDFAARLPVSGIHGHRRGSRLSGGSHLGRLFSRNRHQPEPCCQGRAHGGCRSSSRASLRSGCERSSNAPSKRRSRASALPTSSASTCLHQSSTACWIVRQGFVKFTFWAPGWVASQAEILEAARRQSWPDFALRLFNLTMLILEMRVHKPRDSD